MPSQRKFGHLRILLHECYTRVSGLSGLAKALTRLTVRAVLFYSMLVLGLLSLASGFILYFWPHGPRSGQLIFLGLNKSGWGTWHTYITLIAIALIVVHLLENRNCVDVYVKTTLGKA